MPGRAHKHGVQYRVAEGRPMDLGDIGDAPSPLGLREGAYLLPLHQDPAPVACQCAQHTAEQGAFPHAVGTQKGEKLPPIHIEAHILQHRMVGIGKG